MWRHRREDSTSGRVSEETVRKRNFLYCSIYPIEDVPIPSLSVIPLKQQKKKKAPGRKRSSLAMVTSLLLDTRVLDTSGRRVKLQEHLEVIFFSYVHNCLWWDTKFPGKGVERLRAQLPSQQVLRHRESWGSHLPRCQSSALLPRSSWGGSRPGLGTQGAVSGGCRHVWWHLAHASTSLLRQAHPGVFPEVMFQMLWLCGSRLGTRPALWALAMWQEETCLLQDAYTIWRHCSIT